jgi:hypothetical protein
VFKLVFCRLLWHSITRQCACRRNTLTEPRSSCRSDGGRMGRFAFARLPAMSSCPLATGLACALGGGSRNRRSTPLWLRCSSTLDSAIESMTDFCSAFLVMHFKFVLCKDFHESCMQMIDFSPSNCSANLFFTCRFIRIFGPSTRVWRLE